MIPNLDQGKAIITGNAMEIPSIVKVETNRPKSDNAMLTNFV